MDEQKKPRCKLVGENGNIFNLMGIASRALIAEGMDKESDAMLDEINKNAKSYDEALQIIMKYVDAY